MIPVAQSSYSIDNRIIPLSYIRLLTYLDAFFPLSCFCLPRVFWKVSAHVSLNFYCVFDQETSSHATPATFKGMR